MKKRDLLIITGVLAVLLIFVLLIKRSDTKGPGMGEQIKRRQKVTLDIKNLVIHPEEPTSSDIIRAVATLEKPTRSRITFNYRWYVDGNEIIGQNRSVLPVDYFRKKSKIFCRAKALLGTFESPEKKSKTIKILNSAPVIQQHPVARFSVPGLFTYKVQAHDPDGDKLQYRLVSPLGKGIQVDPDTGEITWDIPPLPPPPEKSSIGLEEGEESMEPMDKEGEPETRPDLTRQLIVVEVVDSEGGTAIVSVKLDLTLGLEITE